jgi:hypothetical protein
MRPLSASRVVVFIVLAVFIGALVGAAPARPSSSNPVGYEVRLLAVAPTNASKIVAIADYEDGSGNTTGEYVLASEDGGQTWQMNALLPYKPLAGLMSLAALSDGDTLLGVAGRLGENRANSIIRSIDGGETWKPAISFHTSFPKLQADPSHPSVAWACGEGKPLLRSDDAGVHWRSMWKKLGSCYSLAVQPHGRVVIALTDHGLFRSIDRGTRWTKVQKCKGSSSSCYAQNEMTSGGAEQIFFDPTQPRVAVACDDTNELEITRDAGAHWETGAVIAAHRHSTQERAYSGLEIQNVMGDRKWWPADYLDRSGRPLYSGATVDANDCGAFRSGRTFVAGDFGFFDNVAKAIKATGAFVTSRDYGRHWSMFLLYGGEPNAVEPGFGVSVNRSVLTTKGLLTTQEDPSALWRLRPGSHAWKKVPLGLPAPT